MSADHQPSASAGVGPLPLAGLRVVEFTHMVMGPAVGAVLAELGAEVVRIAGAVAVIICKRSRAGAIALDDVIDGASIIVIASSACLWSCT